MRTLAAVLCASALLLGATGCSDDQPTAADRPSAVPSSTSAPSSTVPTTVPADPLEVGAYLTTDGSRPALLPTCYGLFGACLGSPIDQLTAMLGPGERRSWGGYVRLFWTLDDQMTLTVWLDGVGSITSFEARSAPATPSSRLGLPDGLVLGEATAGDVQAIYGGVGATYEACDGFDTPSPTFICAYHYDIVDGTVHVDFTMRQEGEDNRVEQRPGMVVGSVFIADWT